VTSHAMGLPSAQDSTVVTSGRFIIIINILIIMIK